MKKLLPVISVLALSACATNNSSPKIAQAAPVAKTVTTTPAATDSKTTDVAIKGDQTSSGCEQLYKTYEAQMALYKPKKKSFLQKSLGMVGAVAGNSFVASKLIGSGMDPRTLSNAYKAIDGAQALSGDNGLSNLMNATSAIGASQQAYAYAGANGCDTNVLAKIAQNNS